MNPLPASTLWRGIDKRPICRTISSAAGAGLSWNRSATIGASNAAARHDALATVTPARHLECRSRNHIESANAATAAAKLNHSSPEIQKERKKAATAHPADGSKAKISLTASGTEVL